MVTLTDPLCRLDVGEGNTATDDALPVDDGLKV